MKKIKLSSSPKVIDKKTEKKVGKSVQVLDGWQLGLLNEVQKYFSNCSYVAVDNRIDICIDKIGLAIRCSAWENAWDKTNFFLSFHRQLEVIGGDNLSWKSVKNLIKIQPWNAII